MVLKSITPEPDAFTDGSQAVPAAHSVDLRKTYGTGQATVHALAGVSVSFEHGRFTAVMGASGSGKSTLMQCMAALDRDHHRAPTAVAACSDRDLKKRQPDTCPTVKSSTSTTAEHSPLDKDLQTGIAGAEFKVAFEIDEFDLTARSGGSVLVRGAAHRVRPGSERESAEAAGVELWPGGDRELFMSITPTTSGHITGRRITPT
jgi:energy-coupling factor transporter ATP-binding protein EcfA2